jgi:hypothetical protein
MDERGEPRAPRPSSIIARPPQRRSPTTLESDDEAGSPVAEGEGGGGGSGASHHQQSANPASEGFGVSFDTASSAATAANANDDAEASSSEAISTDDDTEGNTTEPTSVGSPTASTSDSIPITPQAYGDETDIYAAQSEFYSEIPFEDTDGEGLAPPVPNSRRPARLRRPHNMGPSLEESTAELVAEIYTKRRDAVLSGRHLVTVPEAEQLAAMQIQIEFGEHARPGTFELQTILPAAYIQERGIEARCFAQQEPWKAASDSKVRKEYITSCRNSPTYGSINFVVKEKVKGQFRAGELFLIKFRSISL